MNWLRAMRPHQWVKNLLLLLPILAAQLTWSPSLFLLVAQGFVAFSLAASGLYVLNDLIDLRHDRTHPTKKERAIASGAIPVPAALVLAALCLAGAASLAATLPGPFQVVLGAYALLNAAYSLVLKRVAGVDILTLAALYTARVVAGAALVTISLTGWFLGFSIPLFYSLAALKRVGELRVVAQAGGSRVAGRGYTVEHLRVLQVAGLVATGVSALVYSLYLTTPDVERLYDRPHLLWLGLPLFLAWALRLWYLASRGDVGEDPVLFVVKDVVSYALFAMFLVTVFLAA